MKEITTDYIIYFINKYFNGILNSDNIIINTGIHFKTDNDIEDFEYLLELDKLNCIALTITKFDLNYKKTEKTREYFSKYNHTAEIIKNQKDFIKHIGKWDVFFFEIFISLHNFFEFIFNTEKSGNLKEVENLYNKILNQTGGRTDFKNEIEIFYPIEDCLKTKSFILNLFNNLDEKNYISFYASNDIHIENDFIYFKLGNINNISLDIFNKSFNEISNGNETKVYFENDNLYINGEKVTFKDRKNNTFKIVKLFFELAQENDINLISFEELEKNKQRVGLKDFKFNYESFRDLLKNKNKNIEQKYNLKGFIGINKNGITCQYLYTGK